MNKNNQSYLMFRHADSLYGIEAPRVREIFQLPELTLVADAPKDIIGSLNWRGKLLPIMHLDLRLGQPLQSCRLSDSIIVLDWQGIQVGLVVNQVLDVQVIAAVDQEDSPDYGREQQINTAFVAGLAKVDSDVVVLLNPETLIRQADDVATLIWESELAPEHDSSEEDRSPEAEWQALVTAEQIGSDFYERYCANTSAEERIIFRQRAEELRPPLEGSENTTDLLSLAVIGLGEDYFALELGMVREFINVPPVTTIPCCPPHIMGNINLRGEVMTLVDIRTVIDQPATPTTAKAVVVEVNDIVATIPVDEVFDVMYLAQTEMSEVPLASGQQGYFQGSTTYQDKHLRVLDLPTLFSRGELIVNQGG